MASSASLVLPPDFVQLLIRDIRGAKQTVTIFSHIIAYDATTTELVAALCEAAKRGVSVDVAGDVFTYGILGGWKVVPLRPNERIRALRAMVKQFRQNGVRYRWIGQLGPFLFAGRTHVKWAIVDDVVYSFGGVNLYAKGLEETDYMFRAISAPLSVHLVKEQARITRANRVNKFYRSHQFSTEYGTVLIDGGRPNDSIIYRRACALARHATAITYVSQYCPTGELGKIMAERGAKLYFNHWRQATSLNNRLLIRVSMCLTNYKTLYDRPTFIHAKFILFTMPDGSKVALTGSHNFVRAGVVLGTREIDLETSDPAIIAALEAFLTEHIN